MKSLLRPLRDGLRLVRPVCFVLAASFSGHLPAQTHAVSGAEVLKLTQQYINAAPKRFIGSPGHAAAENFLKQHFAPEIASGNFVTEEFHPNSPIGHIDIRDYVVKYPGKKDGIIVLGSHYETNYWLKDIDFVGANDGACTTALLIAIGRYLRTHPPQGYSVWITFFDAEESISPNWSDSDSLYGSRSLAARWSQDSTIGRIKALLLADMIGWKQMSIDREGNSTPWLLEDLGKAARETGHAAILSSSAGQAIDDDHIPFLKRGVPVLDIIDYEYGTADQPEAFHHTAQDTMDKLSAGSLQASADIFLDMIKLINQR